MITRVQRADLLDVRVRCRARLVVARDGAASQPMCSIATRHTPSGSLRHRITPRKSTVVGSLSAGPLTQDASTQTAARPPRPSVRSGRIDTDPNGRIDLAMASSDSRPATLGRHLHRIPHLRCNRSPRRWGPPPGAQSPADALLLGSQARRTPLADPWPPTLQARARPRSTARRLPSAFVAFERADGQASRIAS
jgi:hypothetical protein